MSFRYFCTKRVQAAAFLFVYLYISIELFLLPNRKQIFKRGKPTINQPDVVNVIEDKGSWK